MQKYAVRVYLSSHLSIKILKIWGVFGKFRTNLTVRRDDVWVDC